MTDITSRLYEAGDEYDIVSLLDLIFNGWPHYDLECSPVDHWRWKFLDVPSSKFDIGLAFHGEKLIGCNHAQHFYIKVGSKIYQGRQGVDFGVHPDYRNMGASKKIGEVKQPYAMKLGSKINYIVTNNQILIDNYARKKRPRFPVDVSTLVKIKDIDLHLQYEPMNYQNVIKTGYKVMSVIQNITQNTTDHEMDSLTCEKITSFDEKADVFWDKIQNSYFFIVKRDKKFLNWRYCDIRGGKYGVYICTENDEMLGYCISRVNKYNINYPVGYIVDLLTIPDRPEVSDLLIKKTLEEFNDLNCIKVWGLQGEPKVDILKNNGFIDSRHTLNLYYQPEVDVNFFGDDISIFQKSKASEIHFQYGDTDVI